MGRTMLRILKVGTLCCEASEMVSSLGLQIKSELGIGGGSTVTLIEAGQKILVDTGFDYEWLDTPDNNQANAANLSTALKIGGMTPDDVDTVFITHWHRDHFGNLNIFNRAECLASKHLVDRLSLENFIGVKDGDEIAEGVRVLFTPGHTVDHASLVVNSILGDIEARVAIAGDAIISSSYFQAGHIWRYNADFYDGQVAHDSTLQIIGHSDIIIPGHGVPFMTYRPEWLKP